MDSSSRGHTCSPCSVVSRTSGTFASSIPQDLAPTTTHRWQLFHPTGVDARVAVGLGPWGWVHPIGQRAVSCMTSSKGQGVPGQGDPQPD